MLHKLHATVTYHYVSSWGHALLGHPFLSVRGPEKAEQFGIWGNVPVLGVCLHPDRPHIPFLFVNANLFIRVCPRIPHSIHWCIIIFPINDHNLGGTRIAHFWIQSWSATTSGPRCWRDWERELYGCGRSVEHDWVILDGLENGLGNGFNVPVRSQL